MSLETVMKGKYAYFILKVVSENPGITLAEMIVIEPVEHRNFIVKAKQLEIEKLLSVQYEPPKMIKSPMGEVEMRRGHFYLTDKGKKVVEYLDDYLEKLKELEG